MTIISFLRPLACLVLIAGTVLPAAAQTDQELGEAAITAVRLFEQQRYGEAVPHFEILIKSMPDHAEMRFMFGLALVAKSKQTDNVEEAKKLSVRALEQLQKAKDLGLKNQQNESLIALLSGKPAPEAEPMYSLNKEAEKKMNEGESFFAQSKYDQAIKNFEKALVLDPTIYQAAVSGGDAFVGKSDWENAEKWYQRAITIDPARETAYRYSATPFMKQKKYDQARERYIEAFITEPYSQMSARGIGQWASVTGAKLAHPVIDIPELTFDPAGKPSPKSPIADDASSRPWLAYMAVRENWRKDKFAKAFPKEKAYRHTLTEQVEALRAATAAATEQKSSNKQLQLLAKIDSEGLLEAYVLLSKPTQGIAEDHPEYLKTNRAKLRQYVAAYVIQK